MPDTTTSSSSPDRATQPIRSSEIEQAVPRAHGGGGSSLLNSDYQVIELGRSVEDRPIQLHLLGDIDQGPAPTLIFAAIHGNERNTKPLADRLIDHLRANPADRRGRPVAVIPVANPDGWARRTRTNFNRIDLNRNFPAANWRVQQEQRGYFGGDEAASEPEAQALMAAVQRLRPSRIVTIHNIGPGRECNNFDGPAESLAELMRAHNGYPVTPTMGYPTPGSFGSWAGVDAGIAVITLELPRNAPIESIWPANRDALLAIIRE
jgi:protein MpaA